MTTKYWLIVLGASLAVSGAGLAGCEKKQPANTGVPRATTDDHAGHDHDDDHDHAEAISLGKATAGGYEVEAMLEEELKAGAEAHLTITVTGGTVNAVRAWIGKQDGAGSVKAKAEKETAGYHAHVEAPGTIAADDKLWVEIENDKGETTAVSFELKR